MDNITLSRRMTSCCIASDIITPTATNVCGRACTKVFRGPQLVQERFHARWQGEILWVRVRAYPCGIGVAAADSSQIKVCPKEAVQADARGHGSQYARQALHTYAAKSQLPLNIALCMHSVVV